MPFERGKNPVTLHEYLQVREEDMSKNFMVSGINYSTLDEAVKSASLRAARNGEEIKVYQAVKLVAPKTPDIDITDIVIS